jgi:hypothetical protein
VSSAPRNRGDDYPDYRSHYIPRTRNGRIAVAAFLFLFALTQPPFINTIANRIEPWFLGLPFFYGFLLVIYCALIGILIWAQRRGL